MTSRKKGKTYTVRWTVEGERQRAPLRSKTAADNRKSELIAAHKRGERFDVESGLPESELREQSALSWYAFTLQYTDVRWPHIGGGQRQSIAEGLSEATLALVIEDKASPCDAEVRAALKQWAYGDRLHGDALSDEHRTAINWLEANTVDLSLLEDDEQGPGLVRAVLDRLSRKQDGTKAAVNYFKRRRATFNTAMKYAKEIRALQTNPLGSVTWVKEQSDDTVDPAVVPNQEQITRLLAAVGRLGKLGERLETFFAVMAYAGLRPEEVVALRKGDFTLPAEDDLEAFGEFRLHRAEPSVTARYNDSRRRRARRRLKHRAEKTVRVVPIHPQLVRRIREHISRFGFGPNGELFVGPRGATPSRETYGRKWSEARAEALTPEELGRNLAAVPYNLRHACVSGWLAATGDPAQVAEWAGHSIETLLRIYAKCVDGSARRAMRRILDSMPAEAKEPSQEEREAEKRAQLLLTLFDMMSPEEADQLIRRLAGKQAGEEEI
ncbi:tyrosine-type recombinase/integrase [Glycomyces sp. MUSA5-2]|uniref:tyrosine-type recombinase/integrase n=1 Tax=Glycomyces sp. MUSA5-2 TaxID=2053002 RepID=UPI00300932C4